MFQSNKRNRISLVAQQYLVGRLMMKYQNQKAFGSTMKEIYK